MNFRYSALFAAFFVFFGLVEGQAAFPYAQEAVTSFAHLTLYIPGAQGGGFDRTGTAIRDALLAEGLADEVEIIRSPGAGGLIGLTQFVESRRGDPAAILVGGRSILGAEAYNRSQISLTAATPVARLNGTVVAVAVAAASPIQDFGDLLEAMRSDPGAVTWVGSSLGSVDELFLTELAAALGIERNKVSYRGVPGGGEEVAKQFVRGHHTVAVSSYEELSAFAKTYDLRIIAVSSREGLTADATPTLRDFGLDISFVDWRGVFAPPGLDPSQTRRLDQLFERLAHSAAWARTLTDHKWQNIYMPPQAFAGFIETEKQAVTEKAAALKAPAMPLTRLIDILGRRYRWTIWAAVLSGILLVVLAVQRVRSRHYQRNLEHSLDSAEREKQRVSAELEKVLARATGHINAQFEDWKLTAAEREIGWMLLKGMPFKEIAEVRDTSERTVRQQARALYAKSGLGNRSDLAAFFLEDFCFGHLAGETEPDPPPPSDAEAAQAIAQGGKEIA